MKRFILLTAMALASLAGAQTSPQEAVQQFAAAWNRKDFAGAAGLVQGANPRSDFSALTRAANGQGGWPALILSQVKAQSGVNAVVVNYRIRIGNRGGDKTESVVVQHFGRIWKIVPGQPTDPSVLSGIAYTLSHPGQLATGAPKGARDLVITLSNIKQLALAAIILASDNSDRFAFSAANARAKLQPYLKNNALWTAPPDAPGTISYSFNPGALGKSMSAFAAPANTVLLYEGKNGKLNFRHEGRAAVAFVDGHAKMVSPVEAKRLSWR